MNSSKPAIRYTITPVLMLALLGIAAASSADTITIRFTIFPDRMDPINEGPVSSSFSFDSSLIPAGAGFVEDRTGELPITVEPFTWGSTLWTGENAAVWFLEFDSLHRLRGFGLGGAPGGFDGSLFGVDDIMIRVPFHSYTLAGDEERFFLGRSVSPDVVTPEPGTLLLLTSGVAAMAVRRRLRRAAGPARGRTQETT